MKPSAKEGSAPSNSLELTAFVSYSHSDLAFVDVLVAELESRGIDVRIDRRDLPYGEEWKPELLDFVRGADVVVFVVSPSSIASRWCRWEVQQVKREAKRLVPIELRPVAIAELPDEISDILLLPFATAWADGTPTAEMSTQVERLVEILATDRDWLKDHTRIGDMARRWESLGEQPSRRRSQLLLRGFALDEAERWLARRPSTAPQPTPIQVRYIRASRTAATRGQRRLVVGSLAVALLAVGLAALAFWQRGLAVENEQLALTSQKAEAAARQAEQSQRRAAQENEKIANVQRRLAERREQQANLRTQAAEARSNLAVDRRSALRLAVGAARESLKADGETLPEVYAALAEVLQSARVVRALKDVRENDFTNISAIAVSRNGERIAIVSADMVHILDGDGKPVSAPIPAPDGRHIHANAAVWLEDGRTLAVASGGYAAERLINARLALFDDQGREVRGLIERHPVPIVSLFHVAQTNTLLAGDEAGNLIVLDLTKGEVSIKPTGSDKAIHGVAWNDGHVLLASGPPRSVSGVVRSKDEDLVLNIDQPALPAPEKETADADDARKLEGSPFVISRIEQTQEIESGGLLCLTQHIEHGARTVAGCAVNGLVYLSKYVAGKLEDRQFLRGHTGPVTAIAMHPSGAFIATAGEDKQIRMWSTAGEELVPALQTVNPVRALAFVGGGARLLSGESNGRVLEWDLADITQKSSRLTDGRDQLIWSDLVKVASDKLLFSQDGYEKGSRIGMAQHASEGEPNVSVTWLARDIPDKVVDIALAPRANLAAWIAGDAVTITMTEHGAQPVTLRSGGLSPRKIAFIDGGARLAVFHGADPDEAPSATPQSDTKKLVLRILDTRTGQPIGVEKVSSFGPLVRVEGNPTGRGPALVSVSNAGEAVFWSKDGNVKGKPLQLPVREQRGKSASAFSPDGKYLALSWSDDGSGQYSRYRIWRTDAVVPVGQEVRVRGQLTVLHFTPAATTLALALKRDGPSGMSQSQAIELRDLVGRPIMSITPPYMYESIEALISNDPGSELRSVGSSGALMRWTIGVPALLKLAAGRYVGADASDARDALVKEAADLPDNREREKRLSLLTQAKAIDPAHARVRVRIGNAMPWSNEFMDRKMIEYDRAIELGPFNAIHYLQRAKLKHHLRDFAGAVRDLDAAERLWYCHLRAPLIIADFIPINHVVAAFTWISQATARLEFRRRRGRAYFGMGKWAEAEADLTADIDLDPAIRRAIEQSIEEIAHLKDQTNAANWRKSIASHTATASAYEMRGLARARQKNWTGAVADLSQAIARLRSDAERYAVEDEFGGAMNSPSRRASKRAQIHLMIAEVHEARRDEAARQAAFAAAVAEYDTAHRLAPDDGWALVSRGRARLDSRQPIELVVADYEAATRAAPENAAIGERFARILIWQKQLSQAREELERVRKLTAEPTITLRARLAIVSWHAGEPRDAREHLTAIRQRYDWLQALRTRGVFLWPIEERYLREIETAIDQGYLGAELREESEVGAKGRIRIRRLVANGPAMRGGLETGDIIVALNGLAPADLDEFVRSFSALVPGTIARMSIFRSGQPIELLVKVGRLPEDFAQIRMRSLLVGQKRYAEALEYANAVVRTSRQLRGEASVNHVDALLWLARVAWRAGRSHQAAEVLIGARSALARLDHDDKGLSAQLDELANEIRAGQAAGASAKDGPNQ